jgi:hypothetical protein
MNPWALIAMAVALIAAAFFFYTGHPVQNSNLYAPSVPGWISLAIFIGIGVLVRFADQWHPRKRKKGNHDDAARKT